MWNDWKWQAQNSVTQVEKVSQENIECKFNMRITPYYADLMDNSSTCPIRQQAVPSNDENCEIYEDYSKYGIELHDSLGEEKYTPVSHLVHRYPDRVMLETTNNCFMYCRFCTRKRLTRIPNRKNNLKEAYEYIRNNKQIRDVLISGGDPLTLDDEELEEIISELRGIEHVEIIRIGTRAPVVLPMRITDELVNMLKKYQPIWINTHFNHPKEITKESAKACQRIVDAGIPMGNQSVLLKGINDDAKIIKELCLKLVQIRVRPYYLYQCDLGVGMEHFRTKVQVGVDIIRELRQNITGFAIPTYVIDAPNGGGKIAISPNNVLEWNSQYVKMKNFKGEIFYYPEVRGGTYEKEE